MKSIVEKYFPSISSLQAEKFAALSTLYPEWNEKINVISRKDIENFEINHLLHSLAIAKFTSFSPATNVIDIGTGGGLPGIPLAIIFPETNFTLIDSIAKKIKVASAIATSLNLSNVRCITGRSEEFRGKYDFVVARAVTEMGRFISQTKHLISGDQKNIIPNGYILLKGGNLNEELAPFGDKIVIKEISKWFSESFFETKKVIYLPY